MKDGADLVALLVPHIQYLPAPTSSWGCSQGGYNSELRRDLNWRYDARVRPSVGLKLSLLCANRELSRR